MYPVTTRWIHILVQLVFAYGISCVSFLQIHTDEMFDISDYEEVHVKSAMECCLRCVNKILCTTVNIRKDVLPMRCRLIAQSPENKLIEASGWNVYDKVPVSYSHLLHTTFFLALNISFVNIFLLCGIDR